MTWQIAFQLAVSGLSVGRMYAVVGLALVIPFKARGGLNFAQGEMVTLGAYIGLVLSTSLPLPFVAVAALTVIIAGAFGVLIERLFIRPIVAAPEFTLVIATFAIGLIIKAAIRLHWQDNTFPFDAPYAGPALAVGPLRVNPSYLIIIACLAALVGVLVAFFRGTKFGKAIRAGAIDPRAARLMGIRVESIFMSAWALAAGTAAFPALLLAPLTALNPQIGQLIVKALVAAAIGGFTSLGAAVADGLLLGGLEALCGAFFGATLKNLVALGILILLLLLKPHALFGGSLQQRV